MYDNRNGFHYETVGDMIAIYRWDNSGTDALIYHSSKDSICAGEFMRAVDAHTEQTQNGIRWNESIRPEYLVKYRLGE